MTPPDSLRLANGVGSISVLSTEATATQKSRIHGWLSNAPTHWFVLYASVAAFATYFCMYAFRKPFAAAKYEGLMFLGTDVNLKTVLLISQIIGYALSKYAGIKVCTEIPRANLAKFLVGLILFLLSLRCCYLV